MDINYKQIIKYMLFVIVPVLIVTSIFATILCAITSNTIIQMFFVIIFVTIMVKPFLQYINWLIDKNYLD